LKFLKNFQKTTAYGRRRSNGLFSFFLSACYFSLYIQGWLRRPQKSDPDGQKGDGADVGDICMNNDFFDLRADIDPLLAERIDLHIVIGFHVLII